MQGCTEVMEFGRTGVRYYNGREKETDDVRHNRRRK